MLDNEESNRTAAAAAAAASAPQGTVVMQVTEASDALGVTFGDQVCAYGVCASLNQTYTHAC
eukprot:SAG11_NODE_4344_length_1940_cov_1.562738_3_plen_61_part_01